MLGHGELKEELSCKDDRKPEPSCPHEPSLVLVSTKDSTDQVPDTQQEALTTESGATGLLGDAFPSPYCAKEACLEQSSQWHTVAWLPYETDLIWNKRQTHIKRHH